MRERTWSPIETAPVEEIKALQLARLIHNVYHVYENVPYYRQRMDEAGVKPGDIHTLADLAKLPFTYKQDLRDTYPYGLFAVPMKEVVELHASSGTTGKQIVAGYTQRDLDIWGDCAARAIVAAEEQGPRLLRLRPLHRGDGAALRRPNPGGGGYPRLLRQHQAAGADSPGF